MVYVTPWLYAGTAVPSDETLRGQIPALSKL